MKNSLLYFLFLLSITTYGQVVLKGQVVDQNNEPITYATISLLNPITNTIVDYEMVDENGKFSMTLDDKLAKFNLRAIALNYATINKEIDNLSQDLVLKMHSETTQLEEIVVKTLPIQQRNDTIVFDLNAFAGKNDRVLEDVIKKMPGLEVEASGQIKYQGKEINKFYVEGKDLMGGSYSAITKAMPNLHVSKLEVLENHQPIKMLEKVEGSENAAINIRLKNKVSFSGSGRVGVGADPLLWNSSLSPMFFSKELQYLFNYDTNNTGDNITSKMRDFSIYGSYDAFSYTKSTATILQIAETSLPSIAQSRYLDNKSHLGSGNVLTKLTDKVELRTNIYYYNDVTERSGAEFTEIRNVGEGTTSNSVIRYSRNNNSSLFSEQFKAVFNFTNNGENNYFKDFVTIKVDRNKNRGLLLINEDPITQSVQSPSFTLQNSMSTLIPISKNKFINFKSIIDFTKDKQDYDVEPLSTLNFPDEALAKYNSLNQMFLDHTFYTQNSFSLSWKYKKWTFSEHYSILYENRKFESNLYGIASDSEWVGDNYKNDLGYSRINNRLNTGVNYKGVKWELYLNFPITWNSIALDNKIAKQKDTSNKVDFMPSISTNYKLSHMWTLRGGAYMNTSYTPLEQLFAGYIFSGLNFRAYQNQIQDITNYSTRLSFEFKNPFNGLFFNGGANYTMTDNKLMYGSTIAENGQQVLEALNKKNTAFTQQANINVGKFFSALGMNIKGSFTFSKNKSEVLLNNVLSDVNMFRYGYGFNVTNNYLDWMNVTYDFNYDENQRKDLKLSTNSYSSSHNLRLDIIPIKDHSIIWKLDYRENTFSKQNFSNRFMDLIYRFKWNKKKIDFDIEWRNILNTKEYEQVVLNNIQTSTTLFKLRPAQVLFTVRFNF